MTVTADDLDSVISCVMSGLLPITDRDWSVPAGTLEWDCWHTAEHIGDCLLSYAWQLAVQPTGRYVRAVATAEKDASPAEVLEFAVTGGRVLASMVRTSRAHVRAYHPAGMADPEGFAGMGCHEALLHGNDIARASASASIRPATYAAASWPGSSRRRPPTWPNRTRGPPCYGRAAASSSPGTPSGQAGAPTPPPDQLTN